MKKHKLVPPGGGKPALKDCDDPFGKARKLDQRPNNVPSRATRAGMVEARNMRFATHGGPEGPEVPAFDDA